MTETGQYRFIGTDSLGYKHGEVYLLTLHVGGEYPVSITSPEFCPYSSLRTYLENWEMV